MNVASFQLQVFAFVLTANPDAITFYKEKFRVSTQSLQAQLDWLIASHQPVEPDCESLDDSF